MKLGGGAGLAIPPYVNTDSVIPGSSVVKEGTCEQARTALLVSLLSSECAVTYRSVIQSVLFRAVWHEDQKMRVFHSACRTPADTF